MPRDLINPCQRSVLTLSSFLISALAVTAATADTPFFPPVPQTVSTVPGNGDGNPYGVAFVPTSVGKGFVLQPGDLLISNFNNTSLQGLGTTIVQIRAGVRSLFFTSAAPAGWSGGLVVLKNGIVIGGSVPTLDGTDNTVQPGSLFFISPNGALLRQLVDTSSVNGPWGLAVAQTDDERASVFVANVLNGTITRFDLALTMRPPSFKILRHVTIGSGFSHRFDSGAIVLGPSGLAYSCEKDVLYVASSTDNAVYAIPDARETMSNEGTGTLLFTDLTHLHGPVSILIAPNGNFLISSSDGSNADPTQPSEIGEFTLNGTFVSQFSVDANTGGSFGIGLLKVGNGIAFAAVDDNANTTTVWNTINFSPK
jgi:sugar lactone lactonase YvrE